MATGSSEAIRLNKVLAEHQRFRSGVVPLCAAETPVSDYVRAFMVDSIHETYAMGGPRVPLRDNFAGSQFVLDLHQLTIDLCKTVYGAEYADPRPHSGTGAVTNALMTLSEPGQRILLQTAASGGHASMLPICQRLGLEVQELPYDFERFDIDRDAIADLDLADIDFVLYAPSDVIYPSSIADVDFAPETTVMLDLTQTLGLIASGHHANPLVGTHAKTIVTGGTHKTLPGPTSGLLMTNHPEIADRLDSELSPKFVRNSHPHHIAALCATLIEQRQVGKSYSDRIVEFAHALTNDLADVGCRILQDGPRVTETHQVFVHVADDKLDTTYARMIRSGLTLNKKRKRLFASSGLRLGVQDIARSCWSRERLPSLASLVSRLIGNEIDPADAVQAVKELAVNNTLEPTLCYQQPTARLEDN